MVIEGMGFTYDLPQQRLVLRPLPQVAGGSVTNLWNITDLVHITPVGINLFKSAGFMQNYDL